MTLKPGMSDVETTLPPIWFLVLVSIMVFIGVVALVLGTMNYLLNMQLRKEIKAVHVSLDELLGPDDMTLNVYVDQRLGDTDVWVETDALDEDDVQVNLPTHDEVRARRHGEQPL